MAKRRRDDRLAQERARRARTDDQQLALIGRVSVERQAAATRRDAARTCGWCGGPIEVKPVGRIPTWCSQSCRQRAWEQKRAAESGLAAVRIVERLVAAPADNSTTPRHGDWSPLLEALTDQLDQGQIYQRELPALARILDQVLAAFRRASQR